MTDKKKELLEKINKWNSWDIKEIEPDIRKFKTWQWTQKMMKRFKNLWTK